MSTDSQGLIGTSDQTLRSFTNSFRRHARSVLRALGGFRAPATLRTCDAALGAKHCESCHNLQQGVSMLLRGGKMRTVPE